jgi:hypothetical protein
VQALLDIAPAIVAVRRGRWPALILLAVAARIALDPGANKHYAAGIAVGALCVTWPGHAGAGRGGQPVR